MKKNKNERIKLIALILVLCITLGYAALRTGLNINGTTNVSSSSWNVHFANYQMSNSTNITPVEEPEIVGTTTTSISYEVDLEVPGDLYEFTVRIVNGGSLDANISLVYKLGGNEIDQNNPVPDYIEYVVSDENDDPIVDGHTLSHGGSEIVKVYVKYRDDDPSVLPSTGTSLDFDIEIEATQAPKGAAPAGGNYTVNFEGTEPLIQIGQALPSGVRTYRTPAEAMAAWANYTEEDKTFYLKHTIENGIVTASYIEFEITDQMVQDSTDIWIENNCSDATGEELESCLEGYDPLRKGKYIMRGGGGTNTGEQDYDDQDIYVNSPYFLDNLSVANTAAGYESDASREDISIHNGVFSARVATNGIVAVGSGDYSCIIYANGSSICKNEGIGS